MNIKRILTPLLIILLLFSIVVMGAPTYVNLGPTSEITGDVGVPNGSGYYINDILFSTIGLIDISTLAKTDSNFIVGDGTNWIVESGSTVRTSLGIDLSLYYLKTEIDTKGEMQTIWSVTLPDLTGTPVQYDYGRFTDADTFEGRSYTETKTDLSLNNVTNDAQIAKSIGTAQGDLIYFTASATPTVLPKGTASQVLTMNAGATAPEWAAAGGGYTNLTSFVDQTAWRVFYSNTDGDVVELALGADGTYLGSNGAAVAPTFKVPAGAGDVVKVGTPADSQVGVWTGDGTIEGAATLTYDGSNLQLTGDIGSTGTKITKGWFTDLLVTNAIAGSITGNAATVTSFTPASGSFTLSGADALTLTTTAATDVTLPTTGTLMANLEEDTDPDLGGQLQSGAHSINFTEQVLTSGTAIAWNLGNSNKATLTAAHNFTITITAPSGALNAQVIITQDGTGTRVMDEIVTQKDEAIATTDVNTTTEIITVTIDIPTGARIRFKTSAADLPAPLVVDTIYYAIRNSATEIKVATTKANAHAGTAIDLTDQGTGTHTVQQLVKWTGGTLEVLSTAAGSEDILGLTYKTGDKQWYAQLSKNFQ